MLYKKVVSQFPSIHTLTKNTMAYELSSMQEENLRRGPWLEEEDERLKASVALLGERRWDALAKESGLRRSGKSCRLRWLNYLRPNLKHGEINAEEELIIFQLHKQWGNKWAKIARRLPGRTDNEIKNYWRSHLRKKSAEAQQREAFVGEINHLKQDGPAPISDSVTPASSNSGGSPYEEKDDMSDTSDDYSYALYELSNSLFGSSPYEARVSDWMSYEQITTEAKHYQTHSGEECWGYFSSCFCYPSWNDEEEKDTSVWDSPSSLWAMD